MKKQNLVRRHYYISPVHASKITKQAKKRGVTESQIVREILEKN